MKWNKKWNVNIELNLFVPEQRARVNSERIVSIENNKKNCILSLLFQLKFVAGYGIALLCYVQLLFLCTSGGNFQVF